MAAVACPRIRWTTFGSAPWPSHIEAAVWRRSCTRSDGTPIAVRALLQLMERFQLDSRSGPPSGAVNSHSSGALPTDPAGDLCSCDGRNRPRAKARFDVVAPGSLVAFACPTLSRRCVRRASSWRRSKVERGHDLDRPNPPAGVDGSGLVPKQPRPPCGRTLGLRRTARGT